MPAWVLPLLLKYVLPFLVSELVKAGVLTDIEADGIKSLDDFVIFIRNLKTYNEYPTDRNGVSQQPIIAETNINQGG